MKTIWIIILPPERLHFQCSGICCRLWSLNMKPCQSRLSTWTQRLQRMTSSYRNDAYYTLLYVYLPFQVYQSSASWCQNYRPYFTFTTTHQKACMHAGRQLCPPKETHFYQKASQIHPFQSINQEISRKRGEIHQNLLQLSIPAKALFVFPLEE